MDLFVRTHLGSSSDGSERKERKKRREIGSISGERKKSTLGRSMWKGEGTNLYTCLWRIDHFVNSSLSLFSVPSISFSSSVPFWHRRRLVVVLCKNLLFMPKVAFSVGPFKKSLNRVENTLKTVTAEKDAEEQYETREYLIALLSLKVLEHLSAQSRSNALIAFPQATSLRTSFRSTLGWTPPWRSWPALSGRSTRRQEGGEHTLTLQGSTQPSEESIR